jgi:CheY-like chemotaxis protein
VTNYYDVLLVEDDRVVQEAAARILRPEGLTVDRTEDVAGAVARMRRAEHGVILSDLMLPGFSGFDLLERVSTDRPQVPVVLITGYATIENALQAFKKGAFDFLPKPFDVAELLGVTRRALRCRAEKLWHPVRPVRDLLAADAAAVPGERWALGQHAWALLEQGRATFGVAESWPGLVGEIREIRLPAVGEATTQGLAFAEILTVDEGVHRIWAPLSGTVVEVHSGIHDDPDLLQRAPYSAGWLVRVAASSLEQERDALTLRSAAAEPAKGPASGKELPWSS